MSAVAGMQKIYQPDVPEASGGPEIRDGRSEYGVFIRIKPTRMKPNNLSTYAYGRGACLLVSEGKGRKDDSCTG
jgi:hypothetical protein